MESKDLSQRENNKKDSSFLGEIEKLEQRLGQGLQFADLFAFTNKHELLEQQVFLYALVELLVSKGLINLHELENRKKQVSEYFKERYEQEPTVYLAETPDKYKTEDSVQVDCENRWHLCKARCCKLWFSLSVQDLEEGTVKWNYSQPYGIAHNSAGYCVHRDNSSCKCTVYENRPYICRTYDCRNDKRIWLDFDNMVINPALANEDWPQGALKNSC